jgi:hypothetical protein
LSTRSVLLPCKARKIYGVRAIPESPLQLRRSDEIAAQFCAERDRRTFFETIKPERKG